MPADRRRRRPLRPRALTAAAALLAGVAGVGAAGSASAVQRVALIVGNAAYTRPSFPKLPNAVNDADAVAAVLRSAGFTVIETRDASQAQFKAALARFGEALHPGDIALFYYAGHGLQAASRARASERDNYLVPVDADIHTPEGVPAQTVALTDLFEALSHVQAGPKLLILDACRQEPFVEQWREQGAGLAWPAASDSRSVFIAFAASPGQPAEDPEGDEHGRFTGELLKVLKSPGRTVSAVFSEVTTAVEKSSEGAQSPWFTGSGAAASLMLFPAAPPEDAADNELLLYREAVGCGQVMCLEFAANRVSTPRLKEDLVLRVRSLKVGSTQPPAPARASAAPPPPERSPAVAAPFLALEPLPGLPAPVREAILRQRGAAAGARDIGRRFLTGADDFPRSFVEGRRWLEAALAKGDGESGLLLGLAFERGVGAPRDVGQAVRLYLAAAQAGSPGGGGRAGLIYAVGTASVPRDPVRGEALLGQAAAAGDVEAMRNLGQFYASGRLAPPRPGAAGEWLRKAADRGYAPAQADLGACLFQGVCGLPLDRAQGLAWARKAADAQDARGAFMLSTAYIDGVGVAADPKVGYGWLKRAADLGYPRAVYGLGALYVVGTSPLGKDLDLGAKYLRRGAELGQAQAMGGLARCYEEGWGVVLDWDEALKWFRAAAAAGLPDGAAQVAAFLARHPGLESSRRS